MEKLPEMFRNLLWWCKFDKCDAKKSKQLVISQTLNYGSPEHWNWIKLFYGDSEIRKILFKIPATEIRNSSRRKAEKIFSFNDWNYAIRATDEDKKRVVQKYDGKPRFVKPPKNRPKSFLK